MTEIKRVVIHGMPKLTILPEEAKQRINKIIELQYQIRLGDEYPFEKAVQAYLHEVGYGNVIIYLKGNNPHIKNQYGFTIAAIEITLIKRDIHMFSDADYALCVWDGKSKTVETNINRLKGKTRIVMINSNSMASAKSR